MKIYRTSIVIVTILLCTANSFATQKDTVSLVRDFSKAAKSRDQVQLAKIIPVLRERQDAQDYMKRNLPKHFRYFELKVLALRLQELKEIYSDMAHRPGETVVYNDGNYPQGYTPNGDIAIHFANQYRLFHPILPNSDRSSNRQIAEALPNQERESNQDYIQRRRP